MTKIANSIGKKDNIFFLSCFCIKNKKIVISDFKTIKKSSIVSRQIFLLTKFKNLAHKLRIVMISGQKIHRHFDIFENFCRKFVFLLCTVYGGDITGVNYEIKRKCGAIYRLNCF